MTARDEHELAPGAQVLSRYAILGKLTQGGMAEVYLAQQRGPAGYNKLVVIKRVRPHLASDKDFVAMFVNEARLAALINHPNVVSIFDLGQEKTDWLLAMEYLDGRDMLQVGRACRQHNKAVPFDVTARIVADACAGLEHAHNLHGQDGKPLNLVHRDMSPENILITFEGSVKVVDFGIAKARDNAFRTQAGQIKGKLGYVAPEAILGKPLDARADIFAIGATLYLFLCGRPAFTGSNPMEIFEKSLQPPTAPRKINKRVPEALEAICMRCLAQDREKRFRSCGELRQALEAHLVSTGRPLGPAQLAQFMKILFPAESDPVRQRTDQLIADGNSRAAAAPVGRPGLFDDDKTLATTPVRPSVTDEAMASAVPSGGSHEATAVVTPGASAPAATQVAAHVDSRAPATVDLPSDPGGKPRTASFGHLKSVDLSDEIEADRRRARADRHRQAAPATIDVDPSMEMEVVVDDEAVEATMVNVSEPSRTALPSIELSESAERSAERYPPPPVDERRGQPVLPSEDAPTVSFQAPPPSDLTAEAPSLDFVSRPPSAPHTGDDMLLPAVELARQGDVDLDDGPTLMEGVRTQPGAFREPQIVHKKAPLAARLGMFFMGAVLGALLLGAGLFVLGDLGAVLAYLGIDPAGLGL